MFGVRFRKREGKDVTVKIQSTEEILFSIGVFGSVFKRFQVLGGIEPPFPVAHPTLEMGCLVWYWEPPRNPS